MAPLRPPLVTAVEFESRTPSNCASGPPGGSASAQHIAIHQSERATTDLLDKPPSSSSSSSYSSSSSSSRTPSPPLSAPLRELYIKQYNNSSDGVMQGKRPKNAFFLYKEDHSKEVKKNSPVKMSGAELVSELARLWNGEPESTRRQYNALAERNMAESQVYPPYSCGNRKRREKEKEKEREKKKKKTKTKTKGKAKAAKGKEKDKKDYDGNNNNDNSAFLL
ncbi:hypothetical protein BCR41DRAFT_137047 [Lobosporangium transversale]|uniref:HMG box domain-containing protein n=1 Tax=Lobosporangium transversale TaxID=64571 RepID=A0A1Y2GFA2_9FUNG|nr:hypothetical protein BCR41DRAFT_137047 [Lobosporangium transversale]ORZ09319.1 hypothetical protein BCR41DRAFT_137047 [Lobosporangium transversale]|eukprot:XP_021878772.1 hypothetical protein BCR41DRAFT_137047 [Lobosporangium transversale]